MLDKEKRIKEERLREASKNGYTGLGGKFGTILKHLGHPIITESSSFYEANYMDDIYAIEEDDEIPTMDEEQTIMKLGYIFDGLSSGIHMEIKYISHEQKLTVSYKGFTVYSEIAGELECYVPSTEWEKHIESLYQRAKIRENKERIVDLMENRQETQKQKESLLERLRLRWGL